MKRIIQKAFEFGRNYKGKPTLDEWVKLNKPSIWDIQDAMGLKKIEDERGIRYEGIVCTGEFKGVDDYGAGILEVSIRNNPPSAHSGVAISTIDDGVWHSFGEVDQEKVIAMGKKFIKDFGNVLPTEKEFNEWLRPFGLYGEFTG